MTAPTKTKTWPDPLPPHRDGIVLLKDGRRLGYAEFGDPSGPPILYFHGFPGCRAEAGMVPHGPARLIALDRPGYGLSDPMPGRRLLDWPADVARLVETLALERPYVVGMSGGAPYAAACAYAIPHLLSGAALLAGMAPSGHGWEAGSPAGALMAMGRRPLALRLAAVAMREIIRRGDPFSAAATLGRRFGMPTLEVDLLMPTVAARVLAGWREALAHGIDGPLSDAAIYGTPWGFDLAAIRLPVAVWHGDADRTVPVGAAHHYAARIPGARLHVMAGEAHFSLALRHNRAILADLLDGSGAARAA